MVNKSFYWFLGWSSIVCIFCCEGVGEGRARRISEEVESVKSELLLLEMKFWGKKGWRCTVVMKRGGVPEEEWREELRRHGYGCAPLQTVSLQVLSSCDLLSPIFDRIWIESLLEKPSSKCGFRWFELFSLSVVAVWWSCWVVVD
jgi:hypothetical protein